MRRKPVLGSVLFTAVAALVLSGCGDLASGQTSGQTSGQGADQEGKLEVMASFYPLQFVAEQVGGELVQVSSLTPPGAEPHDLELSPATVSRLDAADAVLYLPGFPAAVDEAVEHAPPEHVIDVSEAANLKTNSDPHFWLDPERMAKVAQLVGDELADADPGNAATYQANAEDLVRELHELDDAYTLGLAQCEFRTIVVSHEAYGYLADKYGLEQVGISGIDPEAAPSPVRVAKIRDVIEDKNVQTIFTESLVNPKVAETLAADLGIDVALLNPVEAQTHEGTDYLEEMRNNLSALREALNCA